MKNKNIENIYELTPLQQGMLFQHLYSPESTVYNMQINYILHGKLDSDAFQESWKLLVERHAILRTAFVWERVQKPYQVVHRQTGFEVSRFDLSELSGAKLEQAVDKVASEQSGHQFELDKAPLIRVALIRLGESQHQLLWTFHHIILEGWSAGLLLSELWAIYDALRQQKSPELEPALPYTDYINWLKQQDQSAAENYWRQQFSDFAQPSHLSIDKAQVTDMADVVKVDMQTLDLSDELAVAISSMAQNNQVTVNTVFQGLWAIILAYYSGENSVVYGTTVSGRPPDLTGSESIIGLFVNTLPVRVNVNSDEQLIHWLQKLQLNQAKMRHYEYSSLMQVKSWSGLPGGQPLFNTMVAFENWSENTPSGQVLADLSIESIDARKESDQPLTLFAAAGSKNALTLMYDVSRFDKEAIKQLLRHCHNLLQSMVANPEQVLSRLTILCKTESKQLLDWHRPQSGYPKQQTIQQLFEQQVAERPDAIAIEHENDSLSYAQLNEQANRLAHYLQAQGVGPEVLVGLSVERSLSMMVAILGIIKAGGAYLPLDPDYPQSRLSFMLSDAKVPVVISTSSQADNLPSFGGEILCLDTQAELIAQCSSENPTSTSGTDSLAYVIYTSGSTGQPKGTLIEQRSVVRLIKDTNYVELGPDEVFLQFAPIAFDASTFELWGSLLNGAKLVISPAGRVDLETLATLIEEKGITTLWLTSALFSQMVDHQLNSLCGVRQLLTGGETLSLPHAKKMLAAPGEGRLFNCYGPTENTTFTSFHVMEKNSELEHNVPIGRAISNTTVYILDKYMQPVPVGVPGELYIGGDGLARGYLNQPALTAEKFIEDPYSDEPGARLYRTGDRVRFHRDGNIEFIGRFDHQVKVRGYRIEPGEIETVLIAHENVNEAVVVVREDEPGDKRLVAYVVGDKFISSHSDEEAGEQCESMAQLKKDLQLQLPGYMLPSAIVSLEKLPLNANGKIDRKALPEPKGEREILEVEYVAPRNEIEQQISDIWVQVLKIDQVGVFDNFFELGGHSLMATQVVSRLRDQLKVELPLSQLFSHSTVAQLSPVVQSLIECVDGSSQHSNAITTVSRDGDLPLSFAQERLWFLDQLEPGNPAYIIPMALRLKGELQIPALLSSLNAIVQRHEVLRTRFVSGDNGPVQLIDEKVHVDLQMNDLSQLADDKRNQELRTRLQKEAIRAFDLASDVLVRGSLLQLGEKEHVLMLTMHHIISDGWSLGVLFRELGDFYNAFSQGQQPAPDALPIQYADFAHWQRNWLSGEELDKQLAFWRNQLTGAATLNLPADHTRPALQTYAGAHQKITLDSQMCEQLRSISKQQGVTLFMTMLTVYTIMLQRYSGQDDIVVGSPIANRNRAELENLIAFFVNMLVIRVDGAGNPEFSTMLKQVSDTVMAAFEHQDIPFEKLVDALQVERDPSRNPLFQVHFALQNAPMETLEFEGLSLEIIGGEAQVTRFDLECHVWARGETLDVVFIYNTDLFDSSTIQRMQQHFKNLLRSVVNNPDTAINQLQMLAPAEKTQLAEQWNQTAVDYPLNTTLAQLFETQVDKSSQDTAVELGDNTLSYSELDAKANQLAHYLQAKGVGQNTLVGVFMERSLEMVIALYAILKAGGAYVPLDPDYPADRIKFMMEDTKVTVLLIQEKLQTRLPSSDASVLCVDSQWSEIASASSQRPVIASAENPDTTLAYVIYTSGSTGRPKGVMIEHRAIVNRLHWMQQTYGLQSDDRVLQKTPFSFDVSVWEFFWPLLNGARLVLAEPEGHKDPLYLSQVINEKKITTLHFVPSMLKVYLDTNEHVSFGDVKRVICSGEALGYELQQQFFENSNAQLHNLYGPTEAAVDVSYWQCQRNDSRQLVPIGRPVANTKLYVLDKQLQLVPVGVSGELHIGGVQLARGYLNRTELTQEKFIQDPFSDNPQTRLYKTGDLVRYLADGAIEYLGRIDNQIKLRGLRIELGEIENELNQLDSIKDAVVVAREDEPGDKRLVAYVVADAEQVEQLSGSHSGEHVDEWQALYEETYRNIDEQQDATFNIVSWNSSYSGEAIPDEQMQQWVDTTVARIAALKPQKILELGCGTGLLLYRLAPDCQRYVGADFSAVAQQQVRDMISTRESHRHVELWQRAADDFSGVEAGDFDMVVINSVVQYLPGMEYLVEVLSGAVAAVAAGGQVFIGDVRSFPLLKAYHASVELYRATADISGGELLRSVQQHVEEENELVIEPAFFHALQQQLPRLSHVEILLKRGNYQNELSAYRYDVILHVEAQVEPLDENGQWLDWNIDALDEGSLADKLRHNDAHSNQQWLGVKAIPNARMAGDVAMLAQLEADSTALSATQLKQLSERSALQAVDPASLWQQADAAGYHLELRYSGSGADGHMDALFRRNQANDGSGGVYWPQEKTVANAVKPSTVLAWNDYATNPLKGKMSRAMIPHLKESIKVQLPDYMVPSVFVILENLPLTANGKVDRKALPMPGDVRVGLETEYTAPRNELEAQLAEIWCEVLKLDQVGVLDDFFDLGGHSLLATQVISRLRDQMGIDLPLSEMFGYPTVAELAHKIEIIQWSNQENDEEDESDDREVFKL